MDQIVIVNEAEVDIRQIVSFIVKESGFKKFALDYLEKLMSSINSFKQFSKRGSTQNIKL